MKKKKESQQERVRKLMKQFLRGKEDGMRAGDLTTKIHARMSEEPWHSISAQLPQVASKYPQEFEKIKERGAGTRYYSLVADSPTGESPAPKTPKSGKSSSRNEEDFYESFAQYLEYGDDESDDENRLSECSKAVAWGGKKSSDKSRGSWWGTPDVVGIFRPAHNADVKFSDEIVSAEIKNDTSPQALITAFGQACSYLLFSHKVYLVIPESETKDARHLEARCYLLGIGLIHFNPDAKEITPAIYTKVLRARAHSPDMFHVNNFVQGKLAKKLHK